MWGPPPIPKTKNLTPLRISSSAIPTATTHEIEGAGHAAPFDATSNFVQLIADTISSEQRRRFGR